MKMFQLILVAEVGSLMYLTIHSSNVFFSLTSFSSILCLSCSILFPQIFKIAKTTLSHLQLAIARLRFSNFT